jgi:hypothetical protein
MPSSLQTVIQHFKQQGWKFEIDVSRPLIRMLFRATNGTFRCFVAIDPSDDCVQMVVCLPPVPEKGANAAAELCVRASYGLKFGRFEFDHREGEFHFHAGSPYPKGQLTKEVFQRVFNSSLFMANLYLPAFMNVIYANVSPAEAIRQIRIGTSSVPNPPGPQPPPRIQLN